MAPQPAFTGNHAYQQKEEGTAFFDDGREIALLHYVFGRSDKIRGSPASVLQAIDEFARQEKYLMNVGPDKGRIITDLIATTRPAVMVELGGYVGYSTILFADAARRAGGVRYISLERDPTFAAIIIAFLELAGLGNFAKVMVGSSGESIQDLHESGQLSKIDMLFLDHYKPAYVTDLKLCEQLGLIHSGTVLAADNVITPGNPPYLQYVRSTVDEKKRRLCEKSSKDDRDDFAEKTRNQYQKKQAKESLHKAVGNPNIEYQSELIRSFEPTGEPDGIEVTRCISAGIQS